jgi:hypothetical protein
MTVLRLILLLLALEALLAWCWLAEPIKEPAVFFLGNASMLVGVALGAGRQWREQTPVVTIFDRPFRRVTGHARLPRAA